MAHQRGDEAGCLSNQTRFGCLQFRSLSIQGSTEITLEIQNSCSYVFIQLETYLRSNGVWN